MRKSLFLAACLGVCALLLTACTKEQVFSAGTEMCAEELELYRSKLLAKKDEGTDESLPEQERIEVEKNEENGLPDVCYYTENGSVWHASESCSYLKRSKDVLQGSVEGATIAGKQRPCSSCASVYIQE